MELIQTEKYGTIDRDFKIHTYKNNNADEIVIQVREVTTDKNIDINCSGRVSMKGNFNLELHEYIGYTDELAAIKNCIIIYVAANPE